MQSSTGELESGTFRHFLLIFASSDEQLYHLAADLFGAGLDTTLTTLKWAILYLASFPEAQEIVRGELAGKNLTFRSLSEMPKTMVNTT